MILVEPDERGHGLGTRVFDEVLERAASARVSAGRLRAVGLDATPGRPRPLPPARLPRRSGAWCACAPSREAARTASPARRARSLRPISTPFSSATGRSSAPTAAPCCARSRAPPPSSRGSRSDGGRVRGYCFGRHGDHADQLGPVVADDEELARELVLSRPRRHAPPTADPRRARGVRAGSRRSASSASASSARSRACTWARRGLPRARSASRPSWDRSSDEAEQADSLASEAREHRFMRRLARSATAIAAASIALLPPAAVTPQAAEQQRPTFPAQAELVTVDVVVTDKSGAPVVGLRREDFTVTEDGAPQEIASFEAVHRPARRRERDRRRARRAARLDEPRAPGAGARELRDRVRRAAPRPRSRPCAPARRSPPSWTTACRRRRPRRRSWARPRARAGRRACPEGRETLLQVLGAPAGQARRRERAGRHDATTRRCGSTRTATRS